MVFRSPNHKKQPSVTTELLSCRKNVCQGKKIFRCWSNNDIVRKKWEPWKNIFDLLEKFNVLSFMNENKMGPFAWNSKKRPLKATVFNHWKVKLHYFRVHAFSVIFSSNMNCNKYLALLFSSFSCLGASPLLWIGQNPVDRTNRCKLEEIVNG